jgi:hypothetical protein
MPEVSTSHRRMLDELARRCAKLYFALCEQNCLIANRERVRCAMIGDQHRAPAIRVRP